MTDKKYTDEEIIKALECHFNEELDEEPFRCVDCPLYNDTSPSCTEALRSYALDIINRQKAENEALKMEFSVMRDKANSYNAENERLKVENMFAIAERNAFDTSFNKVLKQLKNAKTEAYKKFAERLKEKKLQSTMDRRICTFEMIDNLLKEMVSEEE